MSRKKTLAARWNAAINEVMEMPPRERAVTLMFAHALVAIPDKERGAGLDVVYSAWVSDVAATHPDMLARVETLAVTKRRAA